MKIYFDSKAKITLTVLFFCILTSCKRDRTCVCTDHNILTKQTTEVSREVFHDTKKDAQKKCSDKWCGDECGCTLK
jgi:hypothetical protein